MSVFALPPLLLAVLVSAPLALAASETQPEPEALTQGAESEPGNERVPETGVVYRPPPEAPPTGFAPGTRGTPTRRVGGGSRSMASATRPLLYALVPAHVAWTKSEAPALFFYIDRLPGEGETLAFTLLDEDGAEPLVETKLGPLARPGVQGIELSEHGVALVPGPEYEWSVSLSFAGEERSADLVSSGWIVRRPPDPALAAALAGAESDAARVAALAAAGLWYDALAAAPADSDAQRALLRQTGLAPPAN